MEKQFYVYILRCDNDHYYTGYTTDITRRYQEHLAGSDKCKYTRSFKPQALVCCWRTEDKSLALKAESAIKRLTKSAKLILINHPTQLRDLLALTEQTALTLYSLESK